MRQHTLGRGRCALSAAVGALAMIGAAVAQPAFAGCQAPNNFPRRPLTIVVPYGPGGGSAQVSQAMARAVTETSHVNVNMQYKPGGAGVVGMRTYMELPADGYSVLESIDDSASNYASGVSPVNPATDVTPLLIAELVYNQIYIRPHDKRYHDWKSFLAYTKAHPGRVRVANVANRGAMERVDLVMLEKAAGFNVAQVSYDNPGKRYGALEGGHVDALFEQPGDVKGFIDSGDFKPILTLLPQRPKAFPNVPALSDVGIHASMLNRWRGFFVNPKVPHARKAWLECTFQEAWHQPSFQKFLKAHNVDPDSFRDTAAASKMIKHSVATYQAVYVKLGITKKH